MPSSVRIHAVVDEGLGNSCYLLDLGDGTALVVDPPRDLRAVLARAREEGLRIRFAAETHLHADFLSGAVQLAHDHAATVLASAVGRRGFAHRGLHDGDEVDLGGLGVTALATTGHTDEHMSFLVSDGGRPVGVFTGGSLIVGSAARPDLLGPDRTDELARAQYASLRRLAALPGDTAVWPTHGAGSFCSAPPGAERTSTLAHELATNPLLAVPDEQSFVDALLGSLGSHPGYFHLLGERNRRGPEVLDAAAVGRLVALPVSVVADLRSSGAVVVDVRSVTAYAAGHVPGSVSIALRNQFASWLGWVVPTGAKIIIVRDADQDVDDVVWKAVNIGIETIAGELDGGVDAWATARHPLARTRLVDAAAVDASGHVVDVRQAVEYTAGHVPGAQHVELGSVAEQAADLAGDMARTPAVVMCGHGERAATAASLLERAGQQEVGIVVGGPWDWAAASGRTLATGADGPAASAT